MSLIRFFSCCLKAILIFFLLVILAVGGFLLYTFPRELKEFKKDLIDMMDDNTIRWAGYFIFFFATYKMFGFFDCCDSCEESKK